MFSSWKFDWSTLSSPLFCSNYFALSFLSVLFEIIQLIIYKLVVCCYCFKEVCSLFVFNVQIQIQVEGDLNLIKTK